MVKGVNKNIIEINDTGSEVFERIVFYVSPKYGNLTPAKLIKETDKFTFNFDKRAGRGYKTLRRKMIMRRRLFICAVSAAAAAVITAVLLIVF
mgnify:FL=1